MKRFDLMVFDLDGTLIDSLTDLTAAANEVRKTFGQSLLSPSTVRNFIGNGVTALMELVLPDVSPAERQRGLEMFLRYYGDHLLDTTVLYPGIGEVIARHRQCKKAVLTNKQEVHSINILKGLHILNDFVLVWGSDRGLKRKPAPDALTAMMNRLGVTPERTVLIGDGVNDIACAKAAGAYSIAVGYGYSDRERLLALHPDEFVEHAQGLLEIGCTASDTH
ncbi:MAG: HAD-IA family hydrolase [Endomicrobiales bacterium]|jgi:phosphoglycolate phosphatase